MTVRNLILFALTCVTGLALAENPQPPKVNHVDADGAQKLLQAGNVLVLDVRTSYEFGDGHLDGAKNVDFSADDFEQKLAALEREKTVLVHCASGGRSSQALPVLLKLGFKAIYHLDGGISAWQDAGKPVVK